MSDAAEARYEGGFIAIPPLAFQLVWSRLTGTERANLVKTSKAVQQLTKSCISSVTLKVTRSGREVRVNAHLKRFPAGVVLSTINFVPKGKQKCTPEDDKTWEMSLITCMSESAVNRRQPLPWGNATECSFQGFFIGVAVTPWLGLAIPTLRTLRLDNCILDAAAIPGILSCRDLTSLVLSDVTWGPRDYQPNNQSLGVALRTLATLGNLTGLQTLEMQNMQVPTLSFLQELILLTRLRLHRCHLSEDMHLGQVTWGGLTHQLGCLTRLKDLHVEPYEAIMILQQYLPDCTLPTTPFGPAHLSKLLSRCTALERLHLGCQTQMTWEAFSLLFGPAESVDEALNGAGHSGASQPPQVPSDAGPSSDASSSGFRLQWLSVGDVMAPGPRLRRPEEAPPDPAADAPVPAPPPEDPSVPPTPPSTQRPAPRQAVLQELVLHKPSLGGLCWALPHACRTHVTTVKINIWRCDDPTLVQAAASALALQTRSRLNAPSGTSVSGSGSSIGLCLALQPSIPMSLIASKTFEMHQQELDALSPQAAQDAFTAYLAARLEGARKNSEVLESYNVASMPAAVMKLNSLAPLSGLVESVWLQRWPCKAPEVLALGSAFGGGLRRLVLDGCTVDPGTWPALRLHLPSLRSITILKGCSGVNPPDVAMFLVSATSPLRMRIDKDVLGLQGRAAVSGALAAYSYRGSLVQLEWLDGQE